MVNTKPLQDLLAKDMDRREFLMHLGGTLLAVAGIAGLMKKIADPFDRQARRNGHVAQGYGSSAYGGRASTTNDKLGNSSRQ